MLIYFGLLLAVALFIESRINQSLLPVRIQKQKMKPGEWFSKLITRSVKVEGCSCCLPHLLHVFLSTISQTIQSECVCTCSVLFGHPSGHSGKIQQLVDSKEI